MKFRRFIVIAAVLCFLLNVTGCSRISESLPEDVADLGSLSANTEILPSAEQKQDSNNYIYSILSPKEQEYYDIIKEAAENFRPTAEFPEKVDPELLRKIFVAVYFQEPDIFWLGSIFHKPAQAATVLNLSYKYEDPENIVPQMQQELNAAADEIVKAAEGLSDYEKLKLFHDHIVLNCTFRAEGDNVNTAYGTLVEGLAQCEGYSDAFDLLCEKADIPCFVITGTNPEGERHAWNLVLLDGIWYHVDCTWDDPILDPVDTEFIRYYYFLVQDSDIIGATHIADNTYFTYPRCTDGNNYFKREQMLASTAEEGISILEKNAVDVLNNGRKDASVRFTNYEAYSEACSKLFDSKGIKKIFSNANNSGVPRKVKTGRYVRYTNDAELIIHISMIYEGT
ncbi:MAG: transglutaminase domain-containing protein [Huintestinicola sp.]